MRLSPADVAALVKLYEQGATVNAVAKQFNIHKETARAHLVRAGVSIRLRPK